MSTVTGAAAGAAKAVPDGPVAGAIARKLAEALQPTELRIVNESSKHGGHNPEAAKSGAETHFKVEVTSAAFAGKSLVQQHRIIYGLLKEEIDGGVHALALKTRPA